MSSLVTQVLNKPDRNFVVPNCPRVFVTKWGVCLSWRLEAEGVGSVNPSCIFFKKEGYANQIASSVVVLAVILSTRTVTTYSARLLFVLLPVS